MKLWIGLGALAITTALAAQSDPRSRLISARSEAAKARERSASLEAQARAATDQAERARAAQAAAAARVQAAEAQIIAAAARLALVNREQRVQEQRLASRQQPVVRLTAALQTMARRPAGAVLVQPGSIDDLVHVRALLSSMAPQIRAQTAGLRGEVDRARGLRREASLAVVELRRGRRAQQSEQRRLAALEIEQRQRSAGLATAARLEAGRVVALAENTRDLEGLVRELDADAALRDRLAGLPGPSLRPARISDAMPADSSATGPMRLTYRLPVLGPVVRGFGEALPSGARARGVSIGARPGAIVVAPAAGRITFAGLFRGYGAIAILDHGGGHTSLITGLGSNLARIGETVSSGSPLGRSGPNGITVELRRDGQPIDLTPFVG